MQTLPCPPWLCPEHESLFQSPVVATTQAAAWAHPWCSASFCFLGHTAWIASPILFSPQDLPFVSSFSLSMVLPRFYVPLATIPRSPGHFALPLFTLLDSSACRGQASTCNSYFTVESCPPYVGQLVPRGPSGTCRNAPGSSRHLRGSGSEQCRAHYDFRSHFGWQSCWVFAACHSVPS